MVIIRRVAVIGGGFMGSGIAQVSAWNGYDVGIFDLSDSLLTNTKANIERSLRHEAQNRFKSDAGAQATFVQTALSHLSYSSDLQAAVKNVDLVVEAIVEQLEAKQRLFADIERFARSDAILVTNTSSLLVADIAKLMQRRSRFAGLHFFSATASKIVEIIRDAETSDDTFAALQAFATGIGMAHVACKDTHGFIGNGLLFPFLTAAVKMVEQGIAEPKDIDNVYRLGMGHPRGPLELIDIIGLDVCLTVMKTMHAQDPTASLRPTDDGILAKMVADGKLGRKTGQGFYKYAWSAQKSKL